MSNDQVRIGPITLPRCREAYSLIEQIYKSTDMMCQEFSAKYPKLADLEADVLKYQNTAGAIFLVAELPVGLVGYATVTPQGLCKLAHTAYLNMGVSKHARGKAVGRHLLHAAISQLEKERVIEILYLNVRADNIAAVKLYESSNFETIAVLTRDTKFEGKYYDGLLMRRFIG
jgi:ribosomal protein S18 acetylase RimI-like enzyme